jgi:hypothetical protein
LETRSRSARAEAPTLRSPSHQEPRRAMRRGNVSRFF